MDIKFIRFIPFLFSFLIGIISIVLLYIPPSKIEQQFWNKINIGKLRHVVTKKKTEKTQPNSIDTSLLNRSRKNIKWHILMTFLFSFMMLRAQFIENVLFHFLSYLLLVPTILYFVGSVIQRQKMVVLLNRLNQK